MVIILKKSRQIYSSITLELDYMAECCKTQGLSSLQCYVTFQLFYLTAALLQPSHQTRTTVKQ